MTTPSSLSSLASSFHRFQTEIGTRDLETGKAAFIKTERELFAGVKNLWHPARLNEFEFTQTNRVWQRVPVSTHTHFNGSKPVLIKLAVWPWDIPLVEVETTVDHAISGRGIGPKFLAHLTEGKDGRVVGFVAEWLEGSRAAGPGDIDACKRTLGRLHKLGIKLY